MNSAVDISAAEAMSTEGRKLPLSGGVSGRHLIADGSLVTPMWRLLNVHGHLALNSWEPGGR